ncbi:MAG: DUF481 domain-containing protein [Kofleriaceae bacterium]
MQGVSFMSKLRLGAVVATTVGLLAPAAFAQPTPTFTYGKAEDVKDVKDVEWTASAEAGLLLTTGNAETTTVTAGLKASRKTGKNKLEVSGSGALARSGVRVAVDTNGNGTISESEITTDTLTTAETIEGKLRYDRYLTDANSLFVAALGKRDVPAGKAFSGGAQLGYSRQLKKTDEHEAVAELGGDYTYEDLVAPGDPLSIISARGFVGYKGKMSENATLEASAEALANINKLDTPTGEAGVFEDLRLNLIAAISAKIGDDLSMQFSVQAKYDNVPSPLALPGVTFDPGFVRTSSSLDDPEGVADLRAVLGPAPIAGPLPGVSAGAGAASSPARRRRPPRRSPPAPRAAPAASASSRGPAWSPSAPRWSTRSA